MTLFTDGEPLDVDKLNKLAEKVQDMEAQFNSFTTRYDSNNKRVVNTVPIISTGAIESRTVGQNPVDTIDVKIPSNAFLTSDPVPSIFVTIGNSKSVPVAFSVIDVTRTSFSLKVYSSKTQRVDIYWMAISQRVIS